MVKIISYKTKSTDFNEVGTLDYYSLIGVNMYGGQISLNEIEYLLDSNYSSDSKTKLKSIQKQVKKKQINILARDDDNFYGYMDYQNFNFVPFPNQIEIVELLLKFYENELSYGGF